MAVFGLWEYSRKEQAYIHQLKYKPRVSLAIAAGRDLAIALPAEFVSPDLVIPIPSSRRNFRRRLFNPAATLAREISKTFSIPMEPLGLRHGGYSAPQAHQSHARRFSNVRNAFYADSRLVHGKAILLVDDVITTGASLSFAALALRKAGARSTNAAILAYAQDWVQYIDRIERLQSNAGLVA